MSKAGVAEETVAEKEGVEVSRACQQEHLEGKQVGVARVVVVLGAAMEMLRGARKEVVRAVMVKTTEVARARRRVAGRATVVRVETVVPLARVASEMAGMACTQSRKGSRT